MNPILYQYYSTISDKIIGVFFNYLSCLSDCLVKWEDNSLFSNEIEKMLTKSNTPKKNQLMKQVNDNINKGISIDFLLALKLLIEIYDYNIHKDIFTRNFIRLIMKETLLLRNLFFHSTEYYDEHIFRFFENIFIFFNQFEYPNRNWQKFGFTNYKKDDFFKYDLKFALNNCMNLLSQKGFNIGKNDVSVIMEKPYFSKPLDSKKIKESMVFYENLYSDTKFKTNNVQLFKLEIGEQEVKPKIDENAFDKREQIICSNVQIRSKIINSKDKDNNVNKKDKHSRHKLKHKDKIISDKYINEKGKNKIRNENNNDESLEVIEDELESNSQYNKSDNDKNNDFKSKNEQNVNKNSDLDDSVDININIDENIDNNMHQIKDKDEYDDEKLEDPSEFSRIDI